ncbi:hypothetical protein M1432_02420, partial [Patescibacteria group bacterium]|nr:hypothetical protein [Patescibacteria group bacterium]
LDGYVEWMNDEKSERSLIRYLREKYANITDAVDLEVGIKGEVCDVFGNFLPAATTTSVGVSVSGEALPEMLKHLLLDETNENAALVEMILDEGEKVGADQFTKHLDISDWRWASRQYLDTKNFIRADSHSLNGLRRSKMIRWVGDKNADSVLVEAFRGIEEFADVRDMKDVIERLGLHQRDNHDKAWNQFELSAGFFVGAMSFRGWRDLHRMGFSTHFRTLLTPDIGFYKYDKPAPLQFLKACAEVHDEDSVLYREMAAKDIDLVVRQYPMALGNIVGFQIGANLLQHEFVGWQRTKFNVNHEVREVTLGGELILRDVYWWWKHISRADTVPAYVFARTKEGIPLKDALGVVS